MVRFKMTVSERSVATQWRIGRGWPASELQAALAMLAERPLSYPIDSVDAARDPGWTVKRFHMRIGQEPPGPPLPNGAFSRIRTAVEGYRFAAPNLTEGHFNAQSPLLGRDILVVIRVLFVRLLVGLRIGAVRNDANRTEMCFGVRLDTLAGHFMHGSEWVLVTKDLQTGVITMLIDVQWRVAQIPAWWMWPGFKLIGPSLQDRWRRLAGLRLRYLGAHAARGLKSTSTRGLKSTPT